MNQRTQIGLAGVVVTLLASAAPLEAQQHIVHTYSVANGLPNDRVKAAVADRDGFVWICTTNGLSRFDGAEHVTYGVADGLPDPNVNHFLHGRSGFRWVATNGGGVARLKPDAPDPESGVFRAFPVGRSPRSMRVNVLFEARDGSLLAGTDGGLFRARESDDEPNFELVSLNLPGQPDAGLQVWSMVQDAGGRIWVGTSAGLALLDEWNRKAHLAVAPAQGADHVQAITIDTTGLLWLGHDAGLIVWRPQADVLIQAIVLPLIDAAAPCSDPSSAAGEANLPKSPGGVCHLRVGGAQAAAEIRGMLRTPDGWLWMTTSSAGLMAFDGKRFHRLREVNGGARHLAIDQGGDLWIGSNRGVHRVERRGFTRFTLAAEDGPITDAPQRILRGPDGHVYVISTSSTIHRFDGDRWTTVRPRLPPTVGVVGRSTYGAALLDRTGAWWIGTGAGLLRFPAVDRLEELAGIGPVARYTTADGLAGNDIWHLFEDHRGDIWISTRVPGREPLTRWERAKSTFKPYGPDDGLPSAHAVWGFAEDDSGTLWISLWDGGLARFGRSGFQYFAPGDGLPAGPRYQILIDRRGWLWVGGRQVIYSRNPASANPRFETLRTADGRSVEAVAIVEDASGWIYAGTPTGVVRFSPGDGDFQQLGTGGVFTDLLWAIRRDSDSTLWAIRGDGVLRYEPKAEPEKKAPSVWIGGVRVGSIAQPLPAMGATSVAPLRVTTGQQVRIDYFGLAFDQPHRYQVRLEGIDEEWSAPTMERSAAYAGLGPGRYRFLVRAVGARGTTTPEPATVAFSIPPPTWQRGWFLALMVALLASLLTFGHRLRVRRLLELERVRTRIAADLHDDLGASLARVSLLAEAIRRTFRESPDVAERMLGEIGETSRSLVSDAGDIAFSIDPGRGSLDGLAARVRRFAEELLAGTDVEWHFKLEGGMDRVTLSSDQRRHLLAVLKEALHNAVRHGQPRRLTLTFSRRADALEIELVDDGRGFSPDTHGAVRESGLGLRNMRRRAADLGGSLEVVSHPGVGTRVALTVPIDHASRTSMG